MACANEQASLRASEAPAFDTTPQTTHDSCAPTFKPSGTWSNRNPLPLRQAVIQQGSI